MMDIKKYTIPSNLKKLSMSLYLQDKRNHQVLFNCVALSNDED